MPQPYPSFRNSDKLIFEHGPKTYSSDDVLKLRKQDLTYNAVIYLGATLIFATAGVIKVYINKHERIKAKSKPYGRRKPPVLNK